MSQIGRSMVEMLGVLAIVGVLSVAALASYNLAMNRHWANELLDEANKRAVSAMTQIDNGGEVSLGDFTDNVFRGGEFDTAVQVWEGEFGIRVNNVPEAVCQNLVNMATGTSSVAKVSHDSDELGDINKDECMTENDLYIVYDMAVQSMTACVRSGECLVCKAGETAICPENGEVADCRCVPRGKRGTCSGYKCVVCGADEKPVCSPNGSGTGACVCQKLNQTVACSKRVCITCRADETPMCGVDPGRSVWCVCKKNNQTATCGYYRCKACNADEVPICASNHCTCQKPGEKAICSSNACINCAADETPMCASAGDSKYGSHPCVCKKEGQAAICGRYQCVTCDNGTPQCDNETKLCQCVL